MTPAFGRSLFFGTSRKQRFSKGSTALDQGWLGGSKSQPRQMLIVEKSPIALVNCESKWFSSCALVVAASTVGMRLDKI